MGQPIAARRSRRPEHGSKDENLETSRLRILFELLGRPLRNRRLTDTTCSFVVHGCTGLRSFVLGGVVWYQVGAKTFPWYLPTSSLQCATSVSPRPTCLRLWILLLPTTSVPSRGRSRTVTERLRTFACYLVCDFRGIATELRTDGLLVPSMGRVKCHRLGNGPVTGLCRSSCSARVWELLV